MLQPPQFKTSASVGMQAPLHLVNPDAHWMSHWPATQRAEPLAGAGHALPQPPQFAALVEVSTQLPEQSVVVPVHPVVQEPPEQVCPTVHAFPHFPQFDGSTVRSTHAPLHAARPGSQTKSHVLAAQVGVPNAGALHTFVQPPQ